MKENGNSVVFTSPGEGVTALDVHPLNKVFAFAELCINPRVFVYKYPEMEQVSELKGILSLLSFNTRISCFIYLGNCFKSKTGWLHMTDCLLLLILCFDI